MIYWILKTGVIFTGLYSSLLAPVYYTVLDVTTALTAAETVPVDSSSYVCNNKD